VAFLSSLLLAVSALAIEYARSIRSYALLQLLSILVVFERLGSPQPHHR
jgi:hypothetical protein